MKRSAPPPYLGFNVVVIAVIVMVTALVVPLLAGCARDAESPNGTQASAGADQADAGSHADSRAVPVAPANQARKSATGELSAPIEAVKPVQRRGDDTGVFLPTAPPGASGGAAARASGGAVVPASRSGFMSRGEPWRLQLDDFGRQVPEKLTDEIIDRCIEVARDIDAKLAGQLMVLRKRDPRQFEATLRRSSRLYDLAQLKQREPNLYGLKLLELNVDREVSRLTREYREVRLAGGDTRNIEQQLRMQVIVQISFEHMNREDYLKRLKALVDELEIELEVERTYLEEHPDQAIEERLEALIGRFETAPPE